PAHHGRHRVRLLEARRQPRVPVPGEDGAAGVHPDPAVGGGSAGGVEAAETPFWSGRGTIKSAVSHWQRALGNLFKLAGVEKGYARRFRDTFSVALLAQALP